MFQSYRTLGCVADAKFVSISHHRNRVLLMTTVGRQYIIYDTRSLHVVRRGLHMNVDISALLISGSLEFVGLKDGNVHAFACGKAMWKYSAFKQIVSLHMRSDMSLVVLTRDTVYVLKSRSGEVVHQISLENNMQYSCSALGTEGDLLFLGTSLGQVEACSTVRELPEGRISNVFSVREASITAVCLCPYSADILAVGTSSGEVIVYQISSSTELMRLWHDDKMAISSVCFGNEVNNFLITGSESGSIAVWDLVDGNLRCSLNDENCSGMTHAKFCEDIIITVRTDNAIRIYRCDAGDIQETLLRSRAGHPKDCTKAEFIDGNRLLSVGDDGSFRIHHALSDSFGESFSQGKIGKISKRTMCDVGDLLLPPITSFSYCSPRKSEWSSIVTTHEESNIARTWRIDTLSLTKVELVLPNTAVKALISRCGHLAVVASDLGDVFVFYLQEGKMRASIQQVTPSAVTSMHISACNSRIIALSECGWISIVGLYTGKVERKFQDATSRFSSHSALHLGSHLLCVGLEKGSISVYTVAPDAAGPVSSKPIRKFSGHKLPLVALALDPSTQRYLISASLDSTLAVWDLVMECCIATYKFSCPPTSLSLDSSGRFLSTTHGGNRGVFIWSSVLKYGLTGIKKSNETPEDHQGVENSDVGKPVRLSRESWKRTKQYLCEKNLVESPLFQAKRIFAPLFIETTKRSFDRENDFARDAITADLRPLEDLLRAEKFEEIFMIFHKLSPVDVIGRFEAILASSVDALGSKTSLSESIGQSDIEFYSNQNDLFLQTLKFFLFCLENRHGVDRIQVILALFMRIYADTIIEMKSDLCDTLQRLIIAQSSLNKRLSALCDSAASLVNLIKLR